MLMSQVSGKKHCTSYLAPSSIQTGSITKRTSAGGFWNAFNSFMSALFNALRAFWAASIAGIARARSAFASSAICFTSSAFTCVQSDNQYTSSTKIPRRLFALISKYTEFQNYSRVGFIKNKFNEIVAKIYLNYVSFQTKNPHHNRAITLIATISYTLLFLS